MRLYFFLPEMTMKTIEDVRASLKPYPIEVDFPDIRQWKESPSGVDYVHSFDSGVAGPHVLIMALTHGNEVSGAIALDRFLKKGLRPRQGRLTLAFGNVEAYHQFNPQDIDATRYLDEDMNRVWVESRLDGPEQSRELNRARALRPIIETVDVLLDIHSMHEEAAPIMMSGACKKGLRMAAALGVPDHVIADAGHKNGCRLRDFQGFGDETSPKNALLIETGQHVSAISAEVALDTAARFLILTGTVDEADVAEFLQPVHPGPQRFFEVTDPIIAQTMDFQFSEDFKGLEQIERAGTVIATDGNKPIVTPYDNCVLIQPSVRHLGEGVTVVRLAKVIDAP